MNKYKIVIDRSFLSCNENEESLLRIAINSPDVEIYQDDKELLNGEFVYVKKKLRIPDNKEIQWVQNKLTFYLGNKIDLSEKDIFFSSILNIITGREPTYKNLELIKLDNSSGGYRRRRSRSLRKRKNKTRKGFTKKDDFKA
jgi:hypothetical protein